MSQPRLHCLISLSLVEMSVGFVVNSLGVSHSHGFLLGLITKCHRFHNEDAHISLISSKFDLKITDFLSIHEQTGSHVFRSSSHGQYSPVNKLLNFGRD